MFRLALALALTPLAALAETGWPLTLVDGAAPGYSATLALDQSGQVHGRSPCNRYSGSLTDALPEFRVEALMSTRMACADLAAEQAFFDLLGRMERAERADRMLTLTGDGHVMVFTQPE